VAVTRKAWEPIIARAAEIVDEYDTAVTLRQVHYRLVAEAKTTGSGYRNVEADYKNLSRLSAEARRQGTFPSLLDRTRTIERPSTWDSPAEALAWLAQQYRRDLLSTQDVLPVVVVEKATLVAQALAWLGGLCVPVTALRGYASESLERLVLELVDGDGREVELLYAGDHDPTGEDIPRAFEENTGLALRRVALTAEQVESYGLDAPPGKEGDSRAAGFVARHGRLVQVEIEALDPGDLRALFVDELYALIDHELLRTEHARQEAERAQLRHVHVELQDVAVAEGDA
jgi:hypothetical protein